MFLHAILRFEFSSELLQIEILRIEIVRNPRKKDCHMRANYNYATRNVDVKERPGSMYSKKDVIFLFNLKNGKTSRIETSVFKHK